MDYGKFKYESALKARESRKNQAQTVIKEIKIRPKIDPHDYGTKKGHVERFLRQGDKVKVTIMFRGREQSRPELGYKLLQRLAGDVEELGFVESQPKQDGRNMIMVIGPHRKKAETKAVRGPDRASARAAAPASPARQDDVSSAAGADDRPGGEGVTARPSVATPQAASPAAAGPQAATAPRTAPVEAQGTDTARPAAPRPGPASSETARPAAPRPGPASSGPAGSGSAGSGTAGSGQATSAAAPRPGAPRPSAPRPGPASPGPRPGPGSAAPRPGPAPAGAAKPSAPKPGPAVARPAAARPAAPKPSAPRPVPSPRGSSAEPGSTGADSGG